MSKKDKKTLHGAEAFEQYYSALYGDRWAGLKESLLKESEPVPLNAGGERTYYLDAASIKAAVSLPLKGAKNILDMCAAPGGKTLVLARVMDCDASLVSNERSFERKQRLFKVCDEHLPSDVRERVCVTCGDGAVLCQKAGLSYDRILLDAPCSSERHVLCDEKYLGQWSPARIKTLSIAQWALLSSAFRLLNQGGFLLYSTCALSTSENDDVIEKLLKKFKDSVSIQNPSDYIDEKEILSDTKLSDCVLPEAEKTKYGFHILPDAQKGAGPIYYCLIKKISG